MQRALGANKLDRSSAKLASRAVDVASKVPPKLLHLASSSSNSSTMLKNSQQQSSNPMAAILMSASEAIYLACLLAALSVQMMLLGLVLPRALAFVSNFVHTAFLCALSCFDYRWSLEGLSLHYRLRTFERRWAYFLGFGLPMALPSVILPYFVAVGIYALLFPFQVGGTCATLACKRLAHFPLSPRKICWWLLEQPGITRRWRRGLGRGYFERLFFLSPLVRGRDFSFPSGYFCVNNGCPFFLSCSFVMQVLLAMVARPQRAKSMVQLPFFGLVDGLLLRTLVGCCRSRKVVVAAEANEKVARGAHTKPNSRASSSQT
jgi:hypothetical protein